jgi:hypothetical protein
MCQHLLDTQPGLAVLDPCRALKCWYTITLDPTFLYDVGADYLYAVQQARDPYQEIMNLITQNEGGLLLRYEEQKICGHKTSERKKTIGFGELMRTADPAYWVKAAYKVLENNLAAREQPAELLWVEAINKREWDIMSALLANKWPNVKPMCISLNCTNPPEVVEQDSRAGGLFEDVVTYKIEESLVIADWLYQEGVTTSL